ncbi:MAG: hypothetical protein H7Y38_08470 [Armatimonadetes bacterium]|nr:hypothetical protein [Armatimonadota bacterium]
MKEWIYDNKEFILDHWHTSEGHVIVIRHAFSEHRLPPVYLQDLTPPERRTITERLMTQLSETLRTNGIAPQPALQPGGGIKKAGKPRWSETQNGASPEGTP